MENSFTFIGMESDFGITWYSLLLLLLPTLCRLAYDYWEIEIKKEEPDHLKHTIWTGLFMLLVSLIVWKIEPVQRLYQPFILSVGIFILLFDYLLNLSRGLPIDYIDFGKDGKQSFFDKIYERIGPRITLALKIWVALLCFCVYFYMSRIISY